MLWISCCARARNYKVHPGEGGGSRTEFGLLCVGSRLWNIASYYLSSFDRYYTVRGKKCRALLCDWRIHICWHTPNLWAWINYRRQGKSKWCSCGCFLFVLLPEVPVCGVTSFIPFPQINAVRFNNTPISDMLVYLFEEKGWSSYLRLQNLTTDSRGIARFSVNTTSMPKENINLVVSMIPCRFERLYTPCLETVRGACLVCCPTQLTSNNELFIQIWISCAVLWGGGGVNAALRPWP